MCRFYPYNIFWRSTNASPEDCLKFAEEGSCVLIRALEPIEGLKDMHTNRQERRKNASKALKDVELCNGPSKLCQALNIRKVR